MIERGSSYPATLVTPSAYHTSLSCTKAIVRLTLIKLTFLLSLGGRARRSAGVDRHEGASLRSAAGVRAVLPPAASPRLLVRDHGPARRLPTQHLRDRLQRELHRYGILLSCAFFRVLFRTSQEKIWIILLLTFTITYLFL